MTKPKVIDKELKNVLLRDELPGILAWAMEGARAWYKQGLRPPAAVLEQTEDYLSDQDPIGNWLRERCSTAESSRGTVTELYDSWAGYCGDLGGECGSVNKFSGKLSNRGFRRDRKKSARFFIGLGVKANG